jgi:hypothetical protein
MFHNLPRVGPAAKIDVYSFYSFYNIPQEAVLGNNGGILSGEENRRNSETGLLESQISCL